MSELNILSLTQTFSRGTPFEKTAVSDVSLRFSTGETVALIGPTGSGKSTLIRHFNALLRPTSGHILLDNKDVFSTKAFSREVRFRVGLVFQYPEYQLFEETVRADIAFGPKNRGLTREQIDDCVEQAAAFCGVSEELFDRSPLELSGGQKRRVALAGVLAMQPELLVLDEPGAGLDPVGRAELMASLTAWRKSTGAGLLLVTHDMSEAARFGERLLVMHGGRLIADGAPREVFSRPGLIEQTGLALPTAARLADALRRRGVCVPEGICRTDELAEVLLRLYKSSHGGGDAPC